MLIEALLDSTFWTFSSFFLLSISDLGENKVFFLPLLRVLSFSLEAGEQKKWGQWRQKEEKKFSSPLQCLLLLKAKMVVTFWLIDRSENDKNFSVLLESKTHNNWLNSWRCSEWDQQKEKVSLVGCLPKNRKRRRKWRKNKQTQIYIVCSNQHLSIAAARAAPLLARGQERVGLRVVGL